MTALRDEGDDALVQRVVSHVLESAASGALPALRWHLGLRQAERQQMRLRWPQASIAWDAMDQAVAPARRAAALDEPDLLDPLRELLVAHRAGADPVLTVLANVLACACFGSHHLWQDLGAAGRDEVSRLMEQGFPALFHSNTRNLRWKRHLFLQLGERLGQDGLRPPKCDGCGDQALCFDASATTAIAAADPRKTWPPTPSR
jgi:nitrogen fixation protein NifQ